MNDYDIINQVNQGKPEAFGRLVEKYHKQLLNFIFLLIRDEKIVEDIGQEVFLSVYRSLDQFDVQRGTPFSAWLFITARNRCISEIRKRRNKLFISFDETEDISGSDRSPVELLIDREQKQALEEALEKLPEPYRNTMLMDLEGFSLEQIAGLDEVPKGTVKSRLFRARRLVKGLLAKYSGGAGYEKV